jgi:putative sterol carrier protein
MSYQGECLMTPKELFDRMPDNFDAGAAGDMNAIIQFDLSGDSGGVWAVTVADGQCTVKDGASESPTLTIAMDAEDFVALTRGDLNPMNAFMSGKIKLQGDMGLAMKFQSLFGLG